MSEGASPSGLDFRALFEAAPGLCVVLTPDLKVVAATDAFLAAARCAREDVLGRDLFEILPAAGDEVETGAAATLRASLARVLADRLSDSIEPRRADLRRAGARGGEPDERYWSATNVPVLGAGGQVAYIIHRLEDVTRLVRLERRAAYVASGAPSARDRRAPLVLIACDCPPAAAIVRDALAGACCVELALGAPEALRRARELRPDVIVSAFALNRQAEDDLVRGVRASPSLATTPVVLLAGDGDDGGDDLRARLRSSGAQDAVSLPIRADELLARIGTLAAMKRARDILQAELESDAVDVDLLTEELAERKRTLEGTIASALAARDRAEQASRLKSRFLGMVSHELRTPLTALSLHVERMQRYDGALDLRYRDSLRRIAASAGRLRDMIETLLEYARVEGGRVATNVAPLDLDEVLLRIVENHQFRAEQKGLAISCAVATRPAPVESDSHLVELVIGNLIDNAIKFTESGSIEVGLTDVDGGLYRVSVRDSGPGIAEEHQQAIFEPFERLAWQEHGTGSPPGVGLGLALVRDIAGALGGRIEVASRLGEGSTFSLLLPRRSSPGP